VSGRLRAAAALIHSPVVRFGAGRVLALWDIALYRGFRCALYATAGWVALLVAQAVIQDPFVLLGLLAGPLLELGIERGREWLEHYEAEDSPEHAAGSQKAPQTGRLNWRRSLALGLVISAPIAGGVVMDWVSDHLAETVISVLSIFVAGVVITFVKLLALPLWNAWAGRARSGSDAILLSVLVAVPLALAAAFATAAIAVRFIGLVEPIAPHWSETLYFWWAPAFFGLLAAKSRWRGMLVAVALMVVIGAASSWRLRYEHAHLPPNSVFTLTPQKEPPGESIGGSQFWGDDVVSRLFAAGSLVVENAFDPSNYLGAVIDRSAPNASWEMAEEAREAEESERGAEAEESGWWASLGAWAAPWIRAAAGCPMEAMPEAEAQEARNVLFWVNPVGARWAVYDGYHGPFCREIVRGWRSGMVRSWVLLFFFAWGIGPLNELRLKPIPATRSLVRGTLLRTGAVAVGLAALALWGRMLRVTPWIEAFSVEGSQVRPGRAPAFMEAVTLPPSAGPVKLSWKVRRAEAYRLSVEPAESGVKGLPEHGTTKSSVEVLLPPNATLAPRHYRFDLEALGFGEQRKHLPALVEVEPPEWNPVITDQLGAPKASDIAAVAHDGAAIYVAGGEAKPAASTPRTTAPATAATAGGTSSPEWTGYIAKLDGRLKEMWRVNETLRYRPDGSQPSALDDKVVGRWKAVATDQAGNILAGGSIGEQRPTVGDPILDPCIAKFDSRGKPQWKAVIGTDGEVNAVASDAEGNVLVAGMTRDTMPGQTPAGAEDAFVAKLSGDRGTTLWVRQFGSRDVDWATGLWVDPSGSVYVTGETDATPIWYRLVLALGGRGFLSKFDADGNSLWSRTFGVVGALANGGPWIAGLPNGGVYVSGAGQDGAFLARFDSAGTVAWLKPVDLAGWLAAAPDGRLYAVHGNLCARYDENGREDLLQRYSSEAVARGLAIFGGKLVIGGVQGKIPEFGIETQAFLYALTFNGAAPSGGHALHDSRGEGGGH